MNFLSVIRVKNGHLKGVNGQKRKSLFNYSFSLPLTVHEVTFQPDINRQSPIFFIFYKKHVSSFFANIANLIILKTLCHNFGHRLHLKPCSNLSDVKILRPNSCTRSNKVRPQGS